MRWLSDAEGRRLREAVPDAFPDASFQPAMLIPAVDMSPTAAAPDQHYAIPGIDNGRLFRAGYHVPRTLDSRYPVLRRKPVIAMSANATRAWQWVDLVMSEHAADLQALLEARAAAFTTRFPVLRRLSGGNEERAKVEVVQFQGHPAVCKTFRPGKEIFLHRELAAISALRDQVPEVPEVLAHGENWMIMPLYENSERFRRSRFGLLPLPAARQLIDVLERLYEAGWAHLDMRGNNVIFDERAGMKILDFEFARPYDSLPASFAESYDIRGAPESLLQELSSEILSNVTYASRIESLTGLSYESLRHDPTWQQHLKRMLFVPTRVVPRLVRRELGTRVRPALQHLRRSASLRLRRIVPDRLTRRAISELHTSKRPGKEPA